MALSIVDFQEDQTRSTYIGFCIAGMPVDDIWLFTRALLQLNHMLPNDAFCQWPELI
jgi:hypothetical protein